MTFSIGDVIVGSKIECKNGIGELKLHLPPAGFGVAHRSRKANGDAAQLAGNNAKAVAACAILRGGSRFPCAMRCASPASIRSGCRTKKMVAAATNTAARNQYTGENEAAQ